MKVAEGDVALEDCIKLGEYKGLKLTKSVTEITDEAVQQYAESNAELAEVTDENAAVESGDTVNISYVGEEDGKPFEGGTSDSYDLEIGSGSFIDGFEDGVIGMKKGETKDLNLTFPEDYGKEELAGADVVFHVTVNSINRPTEVTDKDLEEAKKQLEKDYDQEAVTLLQSDAWDMVKENSEFLQLRKSDIDTVKKQTEDELNSWIDSMDMSFEEYLEMQDMTQEVYDQEIDLYARDMAREMLLVDALAQAEGLSADDQEQKDEIAELAKDNDQTSEELIETAGEETVYQYVMTKRLLDRIISYADVTVEKVSGDDMMDLEGYDYADEDGEEIDLEDLEDEEIDVDYDEDGDEDLEDIDEYVIDEAEEEAEADKAE